MNQIDLRLPLTNFNVLHELENISIILPIEHPLAKNIRLQDIVRMVGLADKDFFEMMGGDSAISREEVAKKTKETCLFDVGYIKECGLKNVLDVEWRISKDYGSASEYLNYWGAGSLDDYVKIFVLQKINYNLNKLNRDYGKRKLPRRN